MSYHLYAIATILLTIGCDGSSRETITFVLPDDYRGIILVGEGDDDTAQAGPEYEVPDSGLLLVEDRSVFEPYHYLDAISETGEEVPVLGDPVSEETERLFEVGATEEWDVFYFGSYQGYYDLQQEIHDGVERKLQQIRSAEGK